MSTKTIAVDTRVYNRLAAAKKDGESFSRAIDRLLIEFESAHTASDILRGLATVAPLSAEDSEVFLQVISENRAIEEWDESDLR